METEKQDFKKKSKHNMCSQGDDQKDLPRNSHIAHEA